MRRVRTSSAARRTMCLVEALTSLKEAGMASLQARHTRACAIGRPWTRFEDATRENGCTCQPMYYSVGWVNGKAVRERVGHNRKQAERALPPVQADEIRGELEVIKNITFEKWAEKWLASLTLRPSTVTSYRSTMKQAKDAFGSKQVRRLAPADVHVLLG